MKLVRDLPLWPLWVNPEHRVKSAIVMMQGHGVSSLGVVKGDTFLGVVHIEDLLGVGEEEPVELVMRRGVETVPPDMPLRRLADFMADRKLSFVPVLHDEEFVGIVAAHELLPHIGRNVDPLTHLPWSDLLREWGISRLQEGRELTILFFDLNGFGRFNKEFGHMVGDKVLQAVAEVMRKGANSSTDLLCRYGGDEFAIATIRTRDEAELLAEWIRKRIEKVRVDGIAGSVGAAVGIFGGRRTKEREDVHYAATVDNLINRASQECIAAKPKEAPETEPAVADARRFEILSVRVTEAEQGVRVIAVVRHGRDLLTGMQIQSGEVVRVAAEATAAALQDLFGERRLRIADAAVTFLEDGRRLVTVAVRLNGEEAAGSQIIETIEAEAAAEAVLQAVSSLI